jgi:hypothetical protein
MEVDKLKERLASNPSVTFKGNEVLFFPRDFSNSIAVYSTGDVDLYEIKRSLRRGISNIEKATLEDVAHLVVEMAATEISPERNYIFPEGLKTAMKICQDRYHREVREDHIAVGS